MLARVLAMALCLSVCLSVTSWCSVEVVGRIEMVFGMDAFSTSPTLCFMKFWYLQRYGYFPLELFPKPRLREKISPLHIDRRTCYQLSSRKADAQSVINWTVVGQRS